MVFNHDKINKLQGGWYVVYKDQQTVVTEDEMPWIEVPNKKEIHIMGLKRHNKHLEIVGKEHWTPPGETHERELAVLAHEGEITTKDTLIGWFIGYFENNHKHLVRINAITGEIKRESTPLK